MRRREFIAGLASGVIGPAPAVAQGVQKPRRIAVFFGSSAADDPEAKLLARTLQASLQKLGWAEGRDIDFEYRYSAGDYALMDRHVTELVTLDPDVIVVRGNRPSMLVKSATTTIPVVFAQVGDPVGSGLIQNLARPGGNLTGFTHFEPAMASKWMEALKDVAPTLKRVTALIHPETPANTAFYAAAAVAAPALGLAIASAGVHDAGEVEQSIAGAAGPDAGLVVLPHDVTVAHSRLIVTLAMRHRLPGIFPYRFFVTQGGLLSYSIDTIDHWQQVAKWVDRILRGERPANLPVLAPTKFELVINLTTAKSLGLAVAPSFLARADEVIE